MLLASVGQDLAELGRECLARGQIHELDVEDGGAGAVVDGPDGGLFQVWVGVVNGVLTGECDCVEGVPDDVCEHAVAVALEALESEFTFSSIPARVQDFDPEEQRFADIAAELEPGALISLVARQAVADEYFAALLLARAGQLAEPGPGEISAARRVITAAAGVLDGSRWQLHDLVKAGEKMVSELRLLAVRPPTDETLVVVEEAITVWTTLAGHLYDAGEAEAQDIGSELAELHLRLCQVLDPEPLELAARLVKLSGNVEVEPFLDVPESYADVLGADGVAEFEALSGAASR